MCQTEQNAFEPKYISFLDQIKSRLVQITNLIWIIHVNQFDGSNQCDDLYWIKAD